MRLMVVLALLLTAPLSASLMLVSEYATGDLVGFDIADASVVALPASNAPIDLVFADCFDVPVMPLRSGAQQ